MSRRAPSVRGGAVLDEECPLDWSHPVNRGLGYEWAAAAGTGFYGGPKLRDLTFTRSVRGDATLTDNPTWQGARGRPGGSASVYCTGGSSVRTPSFMPALGSGDSFTLRFLFRPTSYPGGFTAVLDSLSGARTFNLFFDTSGNISYVEGVLVGVVSSLGMTTGSWWDLCLVRDGTAGTLATYLNGVFKGSAANTASMTNPGGLVWGNNTSAGGSHPDGNYDGMMWWDRVLGADEVAALAAESRTGNPTRWRWLRPWAFGTAAAGGGTSYPESYAGSATATGSLALAVSKALAGSTTAVGALAQLAAKPLAGSLTGAGSLANRPAVALAGSSTGAGSLANQARVALAGSSTGTGALTTLSVKTLAADGSLTPSGTLVNQAGKSAAGSTTAAGAVASSVSKALAGSMTPAGSLANQPRVALAGSSTPSGSLSVTRAVLAAFAGSLTAVGSLVRAVLKAMAGSVTPAGSLTTSGGSPEQDTVHTVSAPAVTIGRPSKSSTIGRTGKASTI